MKTFYKIFLYQKGWQLKTLVFFWLFTGTLVFSQGNWKNIGPGGGSDLWVIRFQPDTSSVLYVGGDIEGLFKTVDRGQTWTSLMKTLAQGPYGANVYFINDLVIHPTNYQTLYLCTGVGLFKSTDGGQTWNPLYFEIMGDDPVMVSTVAVDPANPNILYMGLGGKQEGKSADFQPYAPMMAKRGCLKVRMVG